MAHGDLRFLNGVGRGEQYSDCMYHLGKTLCRYVFQICNIFHNLDSSFYPIWTSCKVLFQKQMGQIWDIVFTKFLHYRKACNYLAYFSNYLMVVYQSPHCKRKNYCFSLSFLFSYSFLTHKNTTHTTTFTVCNDEPIRKQLKLSHCVAEGRP